MMFSVDDVRQVQIDLELRDVHVVYVCGEGFSLAHTDAERARQQVLSLGECRYHYWMTRLEDPEWAACLWEFPGPGFYVLRGFVHAEGLAL